MYLYDDSLANDNLEYRAFPLTNASYPYHFHRSYELIHVVSGTLHITIEDHEYDLTVGDMAFVFPNQLHSFHTADYSDIFIVIFAPELIPHFQRYYLNRCPNHPIIKIEPLHIHDIQLSNMYLKKSFLYRMCGILVEQSDFIEYSSRIASHALLHKMLSFVEYNYSKKFTLSELCHEIGYDYTYLSKYFQKRIGIPFTSYLNQYRVAHACELLKNTDQSITNISNLCGYDNIRSFNRNFKSVMKISPREYRK